MHKFARRNEWFAKAEDGRVFRLKDGIECDAEIYKPLEPPSEVNLYRDFIDDGHRMRGRIDPKFNRPDDSGKTIDDIQAEKHPFQCDVCNKIFKARIGLAGHKRSHKKGG
jgi:hypothetical protein